MRGTKDLLARLLLAFALMLAALPLRAGETPCAPKARPVCEMACCAKRAMLSCGVSDNLKDGSRKAAKAQRACGCELKTAPAPSLGAPSAILSAFDPHAFLALPPASDVHPTFDLYLNKPGIFGIDSGPPPEPSQSSNASRAPPFVRA